MKECPNCNSCYEDLLDKCPADNVRLETAFPGSAVLAGKYRLESCLGKGGMGSVYKAMHLGLKRYVALKTLLPKNQSQVEFSERFRREAEAAGRIKHPNVVDVMDFGFEEIGGRRIGYLTMEFLEGCSLRDLIRKEGKLSLEKAVELLNQVCGAVDAAHKLGVIHRDLKPDNIWILDGSAGSSRVKVLDFGLAKLADREKPIAKTENVPVKESRLDRSISLNADSAALANADETDRKESSSGADSNFAEPKKIENRSSPSYKNSIGVSDIFNSNSDDSAFYEGAFLKDYPASEDLFTDATQGAAKLTLDLEPDRTKGDGVFTEGKAENITEGSLPIDTDLFRATVEELTRTGAMIGTLPYMSPEQCLSKTSTAASDIYSLGVIAFEMLTGRRPFIGKGFELVGQHVKDAPLVPSVFVPELPKSVDEAILSALEKTPEQRPSSALEFAQLLGAHLKEMKQKKARLRRIAGIGGAASAVLLITAIIGNWLIIEEYWQRLKVGLGLVEATKQSLRYTSLKLISIRSGKEFTLSTSNPDVLGPEDSSSKTTERKHQGAFSRDGRYIAFYKPKDRAIKIEIWDTVEMKNLIGISIPDLPDKIRKIEFSPDSKLLIVASLNQIRIIDVASGQVLYNLETLENNDSALFLPNDSKRLFAASVRRPFTEVGFSGISFPLRETNSLISLWKIDSGKKEYDLVHHYGEVEMMDIALSGQGAFLLLQWRVSEDEPSRKIELWDLRKSPTLKREWSVKGPGGFAVASDMKRIALRLASDRVVEFDPISDKSIMDISLNHSNGYAAIKYDDSGRLLTVMREAVMDIKEGKKIFSLNGMLFPVELSPDGENILLESYVFEELPDGS